MSIGRIDCRNLRRISRCVACSCKARQAAARLNAEGKNFIAGGILIGDIHEFSSAVGDYATHLLRALRAVLPAETPVLPVGGIHAGNLAAWQAAGAAGFGIGSAIYRPGDSAGTVAAKAHSLVAALTEH